VAAGWVDATTLGDAPLLGDGFDPQAAPTTPDSGSRPVGRLPHFAHDSWCAISVYRGLSDGDSLPSRLGFGPEPAHRARQPAPVDRRRAVDRQLERDLGAGGGGRDAPPGRSRRTAPVGSARHLLPVTPGAPRQGGANVVQRPMTATTPSLGGTHMQYHHVIGTVREWMANLLEDLGGRLRARH
jgi:hypothetical protein